MSSGAAARSHEDSTDPADSTDPPPPAGPHAMELLRTYGHRRPPYPFASGGERTVGQAYGLAFLRARSLVYLEDQCLWSVPVARATAEALQTAWRASTWRTARGCRSACTPRSASWTTSGPPAARTTNRRSWTHDSELTCAVLDPTTAWDLWGRTADALDAWHAGGRQGERS